MKSRIWQLAGVGVLGLGISLGALAEVPGEGHGNDGGPGRALNSRDQVQQTQPARPGYYQDIPRYNGNNRHWQAGGPGQRPGGDWQGRPDGHGNGWGPGPRYRPGHSIDRFPDRYWQVPYRGEQYYYSAGYWYRPHGDRYVVVAPPRGVRVDYLPPYAREVWLGGALFFLVADTYYQYLADAQQYVVVNPPASAPPPLPAAAPPGTGYDVIAYPMHGQGPEQQDQDRYQCHRWAVSESGFDPATAPYAPAAQVASNYRRALSACLSGRGYSVD